MERSLNEILSRINRKLNYFAEEVNFPKETGLYKTQTKLIKSQLQSSSHYNPRQKQIQNISYRYNQQKEPYQSFSSIIKNKSNKTIISQQQSPNLYSFNKNKNKNQQLQNQRMYHGLDKLNNQEVFAKISHHNTRNNHEQNFLSLRKRNITLEKDVKNLQNRLKMLQQSIQKNNKDKLSHSIKNSICLQNKSSKKQNNTKTSKTLNKSVSQKNIKKQYQSNKLVNFNECSSKKFFKIPKSNINNYALLNKGIKNQQLKNNKFKMSKQREYPQQKQRRQVSRVPSNPQSTMQKTNINKYQTKTKQLFRCQSSQALKIKNSIKFLQKQSNNKSCDLQSDCSAQQNSCYLKSLQKKQLSNYYKNKDRPLKKKGKKQFTVIESLSKKQIPKNK